jgi:hypothetical protein
MVRRDKRVIVRRIWVGVTKFGSKLWGWIVNVDNWVEVFKGLRPWSIVFFSVFVVIYLLNDISGQVPQALHINFAELSAILGGLVFTGATLYREDIENRKRLMNVAKLFIIATFLFLIFFVFFIPIKDVNIDPFDFSRGGFGNTIIFWLAALGIYGGSVFFASALVNLIISLRKIT